MRQKLRVEWTETASADLEDIIRFIAKDSPLNAARLYKRIRERTRSLRAFPKRGHVVPELAALNVAGYLEMSAPPYRIVYRIEKSNVTVLAVLDGRRDLKQFLAERLLRTP